MESGPLARHWVTALAGKISNEFIRVIDGGLEIDVPKGEHPASMIRWRIPERPNTPERNRARAYHVAYCGMVAYTYLPRAFEYSRTGPKKSPCPVRRGSDNQRCESIRECEGEAR
jgi:hydrogenase large subunit